MHIIKFRKEAILWNVWRHKWHMLFGGLIINNFLRLVQMIMQAHTSHCDFFTPDELKHEAFITQQSWQPFWEAKVSAFMKLLWIDQSYFVPGKYLVSLGRREKLLGMGQNSKSPHISASHLMMKGNLRLNSATHTNIFYFFF